MKWNRFSKDKKYFFWESKDGFKLKLYTDSMFSRVIWQGKFEEDELTFIRKFVRTGDIILDIGANIGLHSLLASRLIGATGTVYSAEPVSKIYNRLLENIELNNMLNIVTIKKAFSNAIGNSEITISLDGYDAWNSLGGESNLTGTKFGKEIIQTITLDSFIDDSKRSIEDFSLIKIDTEGWEVNVLKGSSVLRTDNAPVLMVEYADVISKNYGFSTVQIFDMLTEYGYYLYEYNFKKDLFRQLRRSEKTLFYNIIASKNKENIIKRIRTAVFLD